MEIGFASSDLFKKPSLTMLTSFFENNPGRHTFHFVFIDTSEDTRNAFRILIEKHNSTFIEHKLDESFFDGFTHYNRFGYTTYFRLILPFLVGDIDRLLWIDTDTVVNKDVSFLFKMELVKSIYGVEYPEYDCLKRLSLPISDVYINCGVLLYNIKKIVSTYKLEELLKSFISNQDKYTYADQCFINMFYHNDIGVIPKIYNHVIYRVLKNNKKNRLFISNNSAIVHFVGNIKPWMYFYNNSMYKLYWRYAKPVYGKAYYLRWFIVSRLLIIFQPILSIYKKIRKKRI